MAEGDDKGRKKEGDGTLTKGRHQLVLGLCEEEWRHLLEVRGGRGVGSAHEKEIIYIIQYQLFICQTPSSSHFSLPPPPLPITGV